MKFKDITDITRNIFYVITAILTILLLFSDEDKINQIIKFVTDSNREITFKFLLIIIGLLSAISAHGFTRWYYNLKVNKLNNTIEQKEKQQEEKIKEHSNQIQEIKTNHDKDINKLDELLEEEKGEHRRTTLTLNNYKRHVYEIKREQLTDLITGIPNDRMLKLDLQRTIETIEYGQQIQLIFIDIDNFKQVNDEYSYYKGDELIKLIAQELYTGMRRNEVIYKKSFIEDDDVPLTKSVYRKYTGGDEFIILIKGKQFDAVGLLNRISDNLQELNLTVKNKLNIDFDLKFKAVILQVFSADGFTEDYYKDIWENSISQGLRKIKQQEYQYKVFWNFEKEKEEEGELDGFASKIYEKAKNKFRKQKSH